ncbi:SDR family oxidoreductase [Cyclobacterium amurskyense]|uniref:3-oxoacyl-[acyl-carrier protein] reductase n=1 Tax=Cyclobacterium amurskyense TaxID=320787 RepID=A0A0H4PJA0_9BACT|nr:SDR family oxidoreductase [Cyclobacterium amurskyense]AKP53115.1 3-oxoacyl-[acyl-carrier protein] reductase [Cyclobacterium amurskyense]|tara:strand:- start:10734 stop:11456 length:723 start_codon:yes stop_codon:yes gene_type:complete
MNLENTTAFITGGNTGIGFGIAQALVAEGVNVAITSRSLDRAQEAADKIQKLDKSKGKIMALELDVKDFEAQKAAVAKVVKEWGKLDYFVANAGVGHFAPIQDLSVEQWQDTIDTNLTGVFYGIKASVDALKETKGFFLTISSLAGTNFFANGSAYNASKFGVTGFTQAVMLDLRQEGIRVSTIMPGSVATGFNDHKVDDSDAWKIQKEDIGEIVVGLFKLDARTLPSKIEVRPSQTPKK